MKRLKTFGNFLAEKADTGDAITNDAITKGAQDAQKDKQASGNSDEAMYKVAAETAAAEKAAKDEDAKKAAPGAATDAKKVDSKAPAAAKPGRKLIKGGTEAVAQWQEKLVKAGYEIAVDGGWGKKTQAAYAAFIAKKYPNSDKAKLAAEGTAPAVAKDAPSGGIVKFFKVGAALVAGAVIPGAAPVAAAYAASKLAK